MQDYENKEERMTQVNKKEKLWIVSFFALAIVGFILTAFLLFGGKDKEEDVSDTKDATSEVIEPIREDTVVYDKDGGDAKENSEYKQEDAVYQLERMTGLMAKGDWDTVQSEMETIISEYSLTETEENLRLGHIYSDASTMVSLIESGDVEIINDALPEMNDEEAFVLAPLFLPQEVLYTLVDDRLSLVPLKGDVQMLKRETHAGTLIKEDGTEEMNPVITENPFINDYMERNDWPFLESIHEYDLTVQGVALTAYVVEYANHDKELIGYYSTTGEETRFKNIAFYMELRQGMTEAIDSDWEAE